MHFAQAARRGRGVPSRLALAAAALCAAAAADAAITTAGAISPGFVVFDDVNNAPPYPVYIGYQGAGTLSVDQGSSFVPSLLYVGEGVGGQGEAVITGPTTRLSLTGINFPKGTRLTVGRTGSGTLTVAAGAFLDGTPRASDGCDTGFCGAMVAAGAGAQGTFTVTGGGSRASFLGQIDLARPDVYTLEQGGFVIGAPGGQARGSMQVLGGARVTSLGLILGSGPGGPGALGTESSVASVLIDGPGSILTLQRTTANSPLPLLLSASHANASADMTIRNGGKLVIDGGNVAGIGPSFYTTLTLSRGGSSHLTVTGVGSTIQMAGRSTLISVGRQGGSATMDVLAGASVNTQNLQIGRDGSAGAMRISGAGSTVTVSGRENANAIADRGPVVIVGRSGNGRLEVSQGATLQVDTQVRDGGPAYSAPARVLVAATSDSQGLLDVTNAGFVQAGYIGIARAEGADTGGAGLATVTGGELMANLIEIGSTGRLVNNGTVTGNVTNWGRIGGTGDFIGQLVNHGIIGPGNSPGLLTVQGDFTSDAGSVLELEIADDGHGGFITDRLVVTGPSVNLAGATVNFRFLGAANPNAFLASGGFDIDTFFGAALGDLDHAAFGGATFNASSDAYRIENFSFDTETGAHFQARPVPEPGLAGLVLLGLAGLGLRRRLGRSPVPA